VLKQSNYISLVGIVMQFVSLIMVVSPQWRVAAIFNCIGLYIAVLSLQSLSTVSVFTTGIWLLFTNLCVFNISFSQHATMLGNYRHIPGSTSFVHPRTAVLSTNEIFRVDSLQFMSCLELRPGLGASTYL